jgi:hypothetical protein
VRKIWFGFGNITSMGKFVMDILSRKENCIQIFLINKREAITILIGILVAVKIIMVLFGIHIPIPYLYNMLND